MTVIITGCQVAKCTFTVCTVICYHNVLCLRPFFCISSNENVMILMHIIMGDQPDELIGLEK